MAGPASASVPAFADAAFRLERDPHGRLVLTDADGVVHQGVQPVRAFPLSAPDDGLSLVGTDGRERLWIAHLSALAPAVRSLLEEELAEREFMPTIRRIVAVSTFSTPSTWTVDTDRGTTHLVLRVEEDIRRLPGGRLLIASDTGVSFTVPDRAALDRASRRLLDRFL